MPYLSSAFRGTPGFRGTQFNIKHGVKVNATPKFNTHSKNVFFCTLYISVALVFTD